MGVNHSSRLSVAPAARTLWASVLLPFTDRRSLLKKITVCLLVTTMMLVAAGCDDDKAATPNETEEQAKKATDDKSSDEASADQESDEEPDKATYESLAKDYGDLESAYDEMSEAPTGMAAQMREWGLQMQYMHEHDGHMMPADDGEGHDMQGRAEGEDPDSPEYGPHMPAHLSGFAEWHRQMSDFHEAEAKERREAGDEAIAKSHKMMARRHAAMAEGLGRDEKREPVELDEEQLASQGKSLYDNACATCHATDGTGVTRAFPPMVGAEMVTGDVELLTRITLHGMSGPLRVKGENYNGFMPSFAGRFSNTEIASILTYIRTSWGNDAGAVDPATVAEIREKTKDSPGALSTIKEGIAPTVE